MVTVEARRLPPAHRSHFVRLFNSRGVSSIGDKCQITLQQKADTFLSSQYRAVIALQEDEQFCAALQLLRTLFLTIGQGRANCGSS